MFNKLTKNLKQSVRIELNLSINERTQNLTL